MSDNTRQEIILSLDFLSNAYAREVASLAKGKVWGFRINEFIYHYGASAVYELKNYGKVFADVKINDNIENTKAIVRTLQAAGADLISIHNPLPAADFTIGLAILDPGDTSYECTFIDDDTLKYHGLILKIVHAHHFDSTQLAAILATGAVDDQPLGKEEV